MDEKEVEPIGYTLEEGAAALRCHPNTLRRLLVAGEIPAQKVGKGWRISPRAIERWLERGAPNPQDLDGDCDPDGQEMTPEQARQEVKAMGFRIKTPAGAEGQGE